MKRLPDIIVELLAEHGGQEDISAQCNSLISFSLLMPLLSMGVLTVWDPRYSATYGNPHLRSPPRHVPCPAPQLYSAQYSTFGPVPEQNPVPYLASPAPAPSCTGSVEGPPPPPPLYPHTGGGGSVLGITGHSTLPAHLRHPVTNDMYAMVTEPAPGYRTLGSPAPSPAPGHTTSPVTYIMETHSPATPDNISPRDHILSDQSSNLFILYM